MLWCCIQLIRDIVDISPCPQTIEGVPQSFSSNISIISPARPREAPPQGTTDAQGQSPLGLQKGPGYRALQPSTLSHCGLALGPEPLAQKKRK